MNISSSIVLITGANRGLGRALVEEGLRRGARKIYATARDPGRLSELVGAAGGRVVPLAVDVTDEVSLRRAAEQAPDVTLLVNNAGVLASFDLLTSGPDAIGRDFATNVHGLLAATRAFLPSLERAAAGGQEAAIVNVLSVVSLASMPALGGYSASKAAAASITQGLRAELAKRRVGVHGVFAGAIDTDMTRGMELTKTRPGDVARGIFDGVERGEDDITPDPMSQQILKAWLENPKQVERQFSAG
jgi:NAD(P)-dependent dehydrogenase (short-subunit alcohol dehydrogenase family)